MHIVHFDLLRRLGTRILWRRALTSGVLPSDILDLPASLAATKDSSFKGVDLTLAAVRPQNARLVTHGAAPVREMI